MLWGSIGEPIKRKLAGDTEYLLSFTKGFSEMPSPAQLKASLAEQLSVEQLRDEFRKYIEMKVAQELMDFYIESLDREEIKEYFPRQAATMRIVDQYIREGAAEQVNISGRCREEILSTDVTAYDIFDHARAEVLALMETNFQQDFVETEGFRRIADASALEQQEIRLLRKEGFLVADASPTLNSPPPASSVTPPQSGLLNKFTRFSLVVGRILPSSSR
ncbi:signal transducer, putative [Ectocarpus siliculosus]|uniref:Signal transducer, putative n=1 Tax=Ectocarpus siliculosus TaxID=2880 RepID=D7FU07_ECTSI|nr:signal transducer, putative [Ectocarpus siliculosus]|eukprot:CBJ31534.1 signal transducer, putative [Ectocarpus siliculosus]